jgi:hypothetical protein
MISAGIAHGFAEGSACAVRSRRDEKPEETIDLIGSDLAHGDRDVLDG